MKRSNRERGAAMVEFALILPLLLLVIAGIFDFGRLLFTQVTITNAAREGARAAVVTTATAANVQTRAQAASPGLTITTTPTLCTSAAGNATVVVSTSFTWYALGPAAALVGGGGVLPSSLSSTAVMKCSG